MPEVKLKTQNSKRKTNWKFQSAFTLIELLVVIAIVAILIGLSVFGLQGARQSSRDAQRKSDLEKIRSGLEIYKADCGNYPDSITFGGSLAGTGSPAACATTNAYLSLVPTDPLNPTRIYLYSRASNGFTYELCGSLEQGSGSVTCGVSSACGTTCNYKVVNP